MDVKISFEDGLPQFDWVRVDIAPRGRAERAKAFDEVAQMANLLADLLGRDAICTGEHAQQVINSLITEAEEGGGNPYYWSLAVGEDSDVWLVARCGNRGSVRGWGARL